MERNRAHVLRRGRRPPPRLRRRGAHARAARRRAPLAADPGRAAGPRARRSHRRAGRADGARRSRGGLSLRLAGRRRRESRRRDVPRPEPLSRGQRAGRRPSPEQRAPSRRPDRLGGGTERHALARADPGRRGSRLRRAAQRLRADARDDRSGRGGRPLRGPALVGEEVWPPRRQGARADAAVRPDAERRPAGRRRLRSADRARRENGRALGRSAHQRRRRVRPRLRHGRAHCRGLLPRPRRDRRRHLARARLRAVRRPRLVRDLDAGSRRGEGVRGGDPRPLPGQAARLQLLAVLQLAQAPLRRRDRVLPGHARGVGLSLPLHHARRLPLAQRGDVRARARLRRGADAGVRAAAGARVPARGARLHGDPAPARGRRRLLRPRHAGDRARQRDARAQGLDRGGPIRLTKEPV